jgi:hypothetical protein
VCFSVLFRAPYFASPAERDDFVFRTPFIFCFCAPLYPECSGENNFITPPVGGVKCAPFSRLSRELFCFSPHCRKTAKCRPLFSACRQIDFKKTATLFYLQRFQRLFF